LRYALIAVHYRASLSYSDASVAAATAAVARLDAVLAALEAYQEARAEDPDLPGVLEGAREAFGAALDDDLNVSAGLAAVFDLVRDLNRRVEARSISSADAERAIAALRDLDQVLGILPDASVEELEPELRAMIDARAAARATRDWAASDRLRDDLAKRGISVEDTRDGQRWRRLAEAGHA
jgi:cysteinyl-tRNA synthetase